MSDNKFCIEYAKRGTAGCKKCKKKIDKQLLRIARLVPNPFSDSGGDMKNWFHVDCIFEQFSRARATTKIVEDPSDLDGWDTITEDDRKMVLEKINSIERKPSAAKKATPSKAKSKAINESSSVDSVKPAAKVVTKTNPSHKDNSFKEFRRLCAKVADISSYNQKTALIKEYFDKGTDGSKFQGDLYIWVKLLIPGVIKRVYNLQSKQLVKLFSQLFKCDVDAMITDLEKGDVAETINDFFESSKGCQPAKKSSLTLMDVDDFLEDLSQMSREDDQLSHLKSICTKCTVNDLKMIIRLIKHDLRINSGAKHILDAVHTDAYQVFQASRNLSDVIEKVIKQQEAGLKKSLSIGINLMTPVLPMLAEACKSVEYAMKKCPNGMYAEVKYDGERVQVHKKGSQFAYYSRSLKPVLPHKVQHFKDYIPEAFPHGQDLILDGEVLLIDTQTNKPLPFGTLNVHKKTSFNNANVCLFIFDCLMYNGESLMNLSIKERRKFLRKNMKEVPNRVMFSEITEVHKPPDLKDLIFKAIDEGLEGLVLKDLKSVYEPGKRHWLKVKKDYLAEGAMADTADLVVLGAYFGTGNKGGMKSIFLMGCLNEKTGQWCTVTKVHGGHDDKTLERLQTELKMVKISKDTNRIPAWLNINTSNKSLIPDFVTKDPEQSQVWEITGAEFSKADIHTAHGISIRFPRVTRIRDDKTWKTATTLKELEALFKASKRTSDGSNSGSPTKSIMERSKYTAEQDEDTDVDEPEEPVSNKKAKKRKSSDKNDAETKPKVKKVEYDEDTDVDEPEEPVSNKKAKKRKSSDTNDAETKPKVKKVESPVAECVEYDEDTDVDEPDEPVKRKNAKKHKSSEKNDTEVKSKVLKFDDDCSTDIDEQPTVNKVKQERKKKDCKYGKKCNDDSESHQKKYNHHSEVKFRPNSKIPDLFTNLKIYAPSSTAELTTLKRYVVAFNGVMLDDINSNQATHILNDSTIQGADGCKYVADQWIWDCIKRKKVLTTDDYILK